MNSYQPLSRLVTVCGCGLVMFWTASARAGEVQGFTAPFRDVDVSAADVGIIAELVVREGDRVTEGQVLGRLDDDVLRATLEIADVSRRAIGRKRSAEAEVRMYSERLTRLQSLFDRKFANQEELDQTVINKEIAEAQLLAVDEELQIRQLEHRRIELQLQQRQIRSPINGIVTAILRDRGEYVTAVDPVVLNVVQLDPLLARFAVPAQIATHFAAGQPVEVVVGQGGRKVNGTIYHVAAIIDSQSNTIEVKVQLPNPDSAFRSGEGCWLKYADGADAATTSAAAPLPPRPAPVGSRN